MIKGGVLYADPSKKKTTSKPVPFRAGRGEFFGGNCVHLTGANPRQQEARNFVPFQVRIAAVLSV